MIEAEIWTEWVLDETRDEDAPPDAPTEKVLRPAYTKSGVWPPGTRVQLAPGTPARPLVGQPVVIIVTTDTVERAKSAPGHANAVVKEINGRERVKVV